MSNPAETDSRGRWMALTAALLGWMFDGFEMGLFPLVGGPAIKDLLGNPAKSIVDGWFSVIFAVFLVGAAAGGVVFGWLGDRIGRVRAMSASILTYALFTGACGLATEPWQIVVLRFIAALGMGGEWSLGVALVHETWPNRSRAFLAALIGAASNVGFLLVGLVSLGLDTIIVQADQFLRAIGLADQTVDSLLANSAWRLLMLIGALPALLTFFIRLFVPESGRWRHEASRGATSHWRTTDLIGVLVGALGALLIIALWAPVDHGWAGDWLAAVRVAGTSLGLVVALCGFLYPVARYLRRTEAAGLVSAGAISPTLRRMLLGAALAGVALLGTWGTIQWAPRWASEELAREVTHAKEYTQILLALGAVFGTILAAYMGDWFGRRVTYALLCIGSLAAVLFLFQAKANREYGPLFLGSVFVGGAVTASFYGWLPLYLPELFSTAVRATAQGFSFNFGRILAAVGTLQTATLTVWAGSFPTAASYLSGIYVVGLLIIWLAPETRGRPLPE